MARNRHGKDERLNQHYLVEVTEYDQMYASALLSGIEGLNLVDSRTVGVIIDQMGLETFTRVTPGKGNDVITTAEFSGYQVKFLLDAIEKAFTREQVKAVHAKAAVEMFDNLTDLWKREDAEDAEDTDDK